MENQLHYASRTDFALTPPHTHTHTHNLLVTIKKKIYYLGLSTHRHTQTKAHTRTIIRILSSVSQRVVCKLIEPLRKVLTQIKMAPYSLQSLTDLVMIASVGGAVWCVCVHFNVCVHVL